MFVFWYSCKVHVAQEQIVFKLFLSNRSLSMKIHASLILVMLVLKNLRLQTFIIKEKRVNDILTPVTNREVGLDDDV